MSRYQRVLFSVIPLLLLLALAEAGLRIYDWSRGASAHARASWYWGFAQDRLLGFRSRPNLDIVFTGGRLRLDTNSEGFRDEELPVQPVRPRRLIICMGESSTWGTGTTNRLATWPHQLNEILVQKDPRFVVFNAGMPGYTTVENLQLLNHRLLKYHPEAVVYMGFRNDVEFYMRSLSDAMDLNFYRRRLALLPNSAFDSLLMRSSLLALLATRLDPVTQWDKQTPEAEPKPGRGLTERGVRTFRDQIAMMKFLCDRNGIRLLWVDQPTDIGKSEAGESLPQARALLREELAADRVPLLEAAALYDSRKFPMIDDVHFDDAGNRHLASLLAPQVIAELGKASGHQQ